MKLPRTTGEEVVGALKRAGFEVVGIRGSHHYLYHAQRDVIVTVPVHSKKILAPKTLQAILFQSGITVDEFGRSCSTSLSFTFGVALRTFENAAESSLQPDIFNHPKAQF